MKKLLSVLLIGYSFIAMDSSIYPFGGQQELTNKNQDSTPLVEAILKNKSDEEIIELINQGININGLSEKYGRTPLIQAVASGDLLIAKELLQAGADKSINTKSRRSGSTALIAATTQAKQFTRLLLKYNLDINIKDNNNLTALDNAIQNNRGDVTLSLLEHGAAISETTMQIIDQSNSKEWPANLKEALDHAVQKSGIKNIIPEKEQMVEPAQLLSALQNSLSHRNPAILQDLVKQKSIKPIINDILPNSILYGEKSYDHKDILETPLTYVLKYDGNSENSIKVKTELLEILFNNGANPNTPNSDGTTPLRLTCINYRGTINHQIMTQSIELVKMLLDHGAQAEDNLIYFLIAANSSSSFSKTLLKIITLLLENNQSNVNYKKVFRTPLLLAIQANSPELVILLLKHGAEITDRCKKAAENENDYIPDEIKKLILDPKSQLQQQDTFDQVENLMKEFKNLEIKINKL